MIEDICNWADRQLRYRKCLRVRGSERWERTSGCVVWPAHKKVEASRAGPLRGVAAGQVGANVSVPLYQAKAEMFRVLGHPVRIRVLELLQDGPKHARHLLAELDVDGE